MNTIESILKTFFDQVESNDHTTSQYPATYQDLELNVGFGFGKPANIPWLIFLAKDQSPQYGIFPALYYFRKYHKLVLAYGISEAKRPQISWRAPLKVQTVEKYFQARNIKPYKYGQSYVYKVYNVNEGVNYEQLNTDLNTLLEHYKRLFEK